MNSSRLKTIGPKKLEYKSDNYSNLSERMKSICIGASRIVLKYYKKYKKNNSLISKTKLDGSPVTEADQMANDYIVSELKENFPDIPVISEESEKKQLLPKRNFFLVDPLDGTKEFLKMNGEFTINIGYVEKTRAMLGAVSIPVKNKIYWTQNNSSYCENIIKKIDINGIEVKSTKKLYCKRKNSVETVTVSRSHLDEETKSYIDQYKFKKIKKLGSSLKLLEVCNNNVDLYPRFGKTMEWDICAAHAILKLAGGIVLTSGKKEMLYGKKKYENGQFFVFGNIINSEKYM